MIKLDERLQAVYDAILPCDIVVDIGTDHGKIPIKSVMEGKCLRAIASDISAPSLEKAEKNAVANDVQHLVSCRLGDGLKTIHEDEYDTLIIAGMGGLEIIQILSKAEFKFNRYILLPHRNSEELRKYLSQENICPQQDYMVECNNKFYSLIIARQGMYLPNHFTLKYGLERQNIAFKNYVTKEIARVKAILNKEAAGLIEIKKYYEELIKLNESF